MTAIGYKISDDLVVMKFPVITRLVLAESQEIMSSAVLATRQGHPDAAFELICRGDVLLAEYARLRALVNESQGKHTKEGEQ